MSRPQLARVAAVQPGTAERVPHHRVVRRRTRHPDRSGGWAGWDSAPGRELHV